MPDGRPNETSVFEHRTIEDIYEEVRDVYLRYPQPWVIGYSGGKDSTTVVQLVWKAIEALPADQGSGVGDLPAVNGQSKPSQWTKPTAASVGSLADLDQGGRRRLPARVVGKGVGTRP